METMRNFLPARQIADELRRFVGYGESAQSSNNLQLRYHGVSLPEIGNLLARLKQQLSADNRYSKDFSIEFVNSPCDGVDLLLRTLHVLQQQLFDSSQQQGGRFATLIHRNSTSKRKKAGVAEADCLENLKLLLQKAGCWKKFLDHVGNLETVLISVNSPQLDSKCYSLEIVTALLEYPDGFTTVFKALTSLCGKKRDQTRLSIIVAQIPHGLNTNKLHIQVLVMRFINRFMLAAPSLNYRVLTQCETELAGFSLQRMEKIAMDHSRSEDIDNYRQELAVWRQYQLPLTWLEQRSAPPANYPERQGSSTGTVSTIVAPTSRYADEEYAQRGYSTTDSEGTLKGSRNNRRMFGPKAKPSAPVTRGVEKQRRVREGAASNSGGIYRSPSASTTSRMGMGSSSGRSGSGVGASQRSATDSRPTSPLAYERDRPKSVMADPYGSLPPNSGALTYTGHATSPDVFFNDQYGVLGNVSGSQLGGGTSERRPPSRALMDEPRPLEPLPPSLDRPLMLSGLDTENRNHRRNEIIRRGRQTPIFDNRPSRDVSESNLLKSQSRGQSRSFHELNMDYNGGRDDRPMSVVPVMTTSTPRHGTEHIVPIRIEQSPVTPYAADPDSGRRQFQSLENLDGQRELQPPPGDGRIIEHRIESAPSNATRYVDDRRRPPSRVASPVPIQIISSQQPQLHVGTGEPIYRTPNRNSPSRRGDGTTERISRGGAVERRLPGESAFMGRVRRSQSDVGDVATNKQSIQGWSYIHPDRPVVDTVRSLTPSPRERSQDQRSRRHESPHSPASTSTITAQKPASLSPKWEVTVTTTGGRGGSDTDRRRLTAPHSSDIDRRRSDDDRPTSRHLLTTTGGSSRAAASRSMTPTVIEEVVRREIPGVQSPFIAQSPSFSHHRASNPLPLTSGGSSRGSAGSKSGGHVTYIPIRVDERSSQSDINRIVDSRNIQITRPGNYAEGNRGGRVVIDEKESPSTRNRVVRRVEQTDDTSTPQSHYRQTSHQSSSQGGANGGDISHRSSYSAAADSSIGGDTTSSSWYPPSSSGVSSRGGDRERDLSSYQDRDHFRQDSGVSHLTSSGGGGRFSGDSAYFGGPRDRYGESHSRRTDESDGGSSYLESRGEGVSRRAAHGYRQEQSGGRKPAGGVARGSDRSGSGGPLVSQDEVDDVLKNFDYLNDYSVDERSSYASGRGRYGHL